MQTRCRCESTLLADIDRLISSRTGFAVTGFLALFLNLVLAEEIEDEAASITANEADAADDREEWARIKRGKMGEDGGDSTEKSNDIEAPAQKL